MKRTDSTFFRCFCMLLISGTLLWPSLLVGQVTSLDSLKQELKSISSDSMKMVISRTLTWEYLYSNLDSARNYAMLFERFSEQQDVRFQAEAKKLIGVVHHVNADRISAIKYYNQALYLAEKHHLKKLKADVQSNLGDAYGSLGHYSKAIEYYQGSIQIDKENGNKRGVASGYGRIGESYQSLGNIEKALDYLGMSYEMSREIEDEVSLAGDMNSLAYSLVKANEVDSAMLLFHKALDVFRKAENKEFNVILTLIFIGSAHADLNEPQEALLYLEEAYQKAKTFNYTIGIRDAACDLARVYLDLRDIKTAEYYITIAYDLALETKAEDGITTAIETKIRLEEVKGNFETALKLSNDLTAMKDSLYSRDRIMRIGALEAEHMFSQVKDSLTFAQEKQRLTFQAKQSEDRLIQNTIALVLAISIIFLGIFIILYRKKRRQSEELTVANQKVFRQNLEITNQKDDLERTLVELQAAQRQLIRSEKMASLGVLASGVGHEINNPLNFIKHGVALIEGKMSETKVDLQPYKRDFKVIGDGITRISKIVRGLKGYSRQDNDFDQTCDLLKILENCLEMVNANEGRANVVIYRKYHVESLLAKGNEGKLHQVFLNVLMNAYQAMDGAGTVEIVAGEKNELSEIKIIDSGAGMSPEIMKRIGEPFFTTKPPGEGTGLGLFIILDIIKEHEGVWHIDSEEGKGTTFTLYFPKYPAMSAPKSVNRNAI